ncbi:AraC family transcriptional regulator [Tahibacter amnicola]|uniref:AraC family transcriptional regulator n=1 Tax=Tahibacter amnicola TaxID=2976241 RepID=A0ABY6BDB2_9GAMM|nr:AraC family transcriptional regulator [Tahibacter amnicola]UXI68016.1 AraC family transcriptional regulator [Tahibacter amnicola]
MSMQSASTVAERLFDCAQDILFFVKDRQARYTAVNRTLADRCGVRHKNELIGRTARELFDAPFGSSYYAQDRAVLEEGVEIHDQLQQVPQRTGRPGWCITYKFPIVENREIVGLCGICRTVTSAEPRPDSIQRVARAIDHIQLHYGDSIRVDALARIAGLGTRRLERLVKRLFDMTPVQLLAKTRIQAASRMLVSQDVSVAQVASACGYADQSAFTRQFKALVGATPMHYRALHRSVAVTSGAPGAIMR